MAQPWSDMSMAQKAQAAFDYYVTKNGTASGFGINPTFHKRDFEPGGDYYFMRQQQGSAGGTGGAGGVVPAAALAATQANLPQLGTGGAGIEKSVERVSAFAPVRADEWYGLDSITPDTKLNPGFSPRTINWDGFRRYGSRSPRAGVAKLSDDITTVRTSGGAVLNSDYRGLSLISVPGAADVGDQLLECFSDKDVEIGTAPGANQATSYHMCSVGPLWGRPRVLTGMPGPYMVLTKPGANTIRATVDYSAIPTSQTALRLQSVVAITIRYAGPFSGATPRYPRDIDGEDGTGSVLVPSADRGTFNGTSTAFDTANTLTVGKYWFAAWALSREGISDPSFASFTLT